MNSLSCGDASRTRPQGIRRLIDRQIVLANSFAKWIGASKEFELAVAATLPIVTFRLSVTVLSGS